MSSLVLLVRHGQASFGGETYDELSPLGCQQASLLGRAARARGWRVDRVVSGSMRRQRHTAQLLAAELATAPDLETDTGWDEFDHDAVVRALDPAFADQRTAVAALAGAADPHRAFQQIFLEATARWQAGQRDDYPETFDAFADRSMAACRRAIEADGATVVVSSGGPIATVTAAALTGDLTLWSRLNEVVVNTSVTKLLHSRRATPGAATRVLTFNDHSHLEHDRSLITYR